MSKYFLVDKIHDTYVNNDVICIRFRKPNPDGSLSNDFIPGTTWNDINSLYRFDRKLRLLVFDAIERIEIALRTNGKTGKTLDVYADIQGHITVLASDRP